MSNGYGSNYADVIEEDSVRKFCPKEFKALEDAIDEAGLEWSEVAREEELDDADKRSKTHKCFVALQKAFEKKTGLNLDIGYHDASEEGDCYDDVDGVYFCVGGMYQLTPEGKAMEKYVERRMFVTYG